jgi:hypothetical protein
MESQGIGLFKTVVSVMMPLWRETNMRWFFATAVALMLAQGAQAALPTYLFTDLGRCSDRPAINNSGRVALTSPTGAVVWFAGQTTSVPLGTGSTGAVGINSFGDVSGYYRSNRAAARINGATVDLSGYATQASGIAINDNRSVLIQASSGQGTFLYRNGNAVALSGPQGRVYATGLNNSDHVVGLIQPSDGINFVACTWVNGSFTNITPPNVPSDTQGAALGINDAGAIVGEYEIFHGMQPWLRSASGQYTLLGQPPSNDLVNPLDINSSNQVVGFYRQSAGGYRAVAWDGTVAVPLTAYVNQPGWVLELATGINDSGQIVGMGEFEGLTHAFLLTPVPAPASLCVFVLGACAIGRRRRAGAGPSYTTSIER